MNFYSRLLDTLLDLGDSTSKKLTYAHENGLISFGEETITETNLLEMQVRNPKIVKIRTFSKNEESKRTGADWEWHIIGTRYTLKMRVQAKRADRNGIFRNISHQSKYAPMPQIDLLIDDAKRNNLLPVYCFYSCEEQRLIWKSSSFKHGRGEVFEMGCLIADANSVYRFSRHKMPDIEKISVPWHFLWKRKLYSYEYSPYELRFKDEKVKRFLYELRGVGAGAPRAQGNDFPTIPYLNGDDSDEFVDAPGLVETTKKEEKSDAYYSERGLRGLLVIDTREIFDWRWI